MTALNVWIVFRRTRERKQKIIHGVFGNEFAARMVLANKSDPSYSLEVFPVLFMSDMKTKDPEEDA